MLTGKIETTRYLVEPKKPRWYYPAPNLPPKSPPTSPPSNGLVMNDFFFRQMVILNDKLVFSKSYLKGQPRRLFAHSTPAVTDRYVHNRGTNLERVANVIQLFPGATGTK